MARAGSVKPFHIDETATPVGRVGRVRDALIVPKVRRVGPTIVDRDGKRVPESTLWRLGARCDGTDLDRSAYPAPEKLAGRWLFAGDFWTHFGHYLFESLSRLWALQDLDAPVDGLIMIDPRPRPRRSDPDTGFHRDLLRRVGADLPVRIVTDPLEVEDLIVPEQGSSLGELSAGIPVFRSFIYEALRRGVQPASYDKVYVSRMEYRLRRGGHFAEALLAERLEAEGYYLFSPERASFDEQVAVFMGARKVVSADSTPLHLAGFVGRPDLDVAILLRRADGAKDIAPQLTAYLEKPPLVVDAISRFYQRCDNYNRNWSQFAELDLAQAGAELSQGGFISPPEPWSNIGPRRRARALAFYSKRLGCAFDVVEAGLALKASA